MLRPLWRGRLWNAGILRWSRESCRARVGSVRADDEHLGAVALRNSEIQCAAPRQIQAEQEFGPLWDGEFEALDRLIFGLGTKFNEAYTEHGLSAERAADARAKLAPELYEPLFLEAMPIHDAVDLARFLVQTTIGFVKFSVSRPKTVGGPIEIAAITKHEGFKWIERRHFFPPEHNASD